MVCRKTNKNDFNRRRILITLFLTVISILLAGCQTRGANSQEMTESGILLGIFHEGSQIDLTPVHDYEKKIDKKFASVMWYLDWSSSFPMEDAKRVSKAGYMPHITWEPWLFTDNEKNYLKNILDGEWDDYINKWASDAARFGKPIMLRWGHEFNGNWYP